METISLSISLIRILKQGSLRWLGRYVEATQTLKFVIGQPLEKESFREAITREVAWEFELDRSRDFLVSNMAQLNMEFPESLPSVNGGNPLSVSFYNVEIYRRSIMQVLDSDPRNIWLSSEEIWAGQTESGQRIDPLVHQLVTRSEVIRSWESSAGR